MVATHSDNSTQCTGTGVGRCHALSNIHWSHKSYNESSTSVICQRRSWERMEEAHTPMSLVLKVRARLGHWSRHHNERTFKRTSRWMNSNRSKNEAKGALHDCKYKFQPCCVLTTVSQASWHQRVGIRESSQRLTAAHVYSHSPNTDSQGQANNNQEIEMRWMRDEWWRLQSLLTGRKAVRNAQTIYIPWHMYCAYYCMYADLYSKHSKSVSDWRKKAILFRFKATVRLLPRLKRRGVMCDKYKCECSKYVHLLDNQTPSERRCCAFPSAAIPVFVLIIVSYRIVSQMYFATYRCNAII